MNLVYLSQGKLYLLADGGEPRELASRFGQEMFDRAVEMHRHRAWKTKGRGSGFMRGAMLWGQDGFDPRAMRVRISAATSGAAPGELLYSLDADGVGGLFALDWRNARERRIFHKEDYLARDLARHPSRPLTACALHAQNGTAHIALIEDGESSSRELTEGDSVDEAPSWAPGAGRRLLFQSAGVGRDAEGLALGLGPAAIQSLDLDSGRLETLLEDPAFDHLLPRLGADGALHFIRRPYEPQGGAPRSPWRALQDALLFPLRVADAVFHFLDFFSMTFAQKPLTAAGGPKRKGADARTVFLRGRMIEVREELGRGADREPPALAPADWTLVRRDPSGAEKVLAERAAAYDLAPDGRLVYSDGRAVYALSPDGRRTLVCRGDVIEHVAFVA